MKWVYIVIGIIILSIITIVLMNKTEENITGNIIQDTSNSQEITLSYGTINGARNYILSENTVKAGEPVTITVDTTTVKGCYRSIAIPDLGISKYIQESDNKITFTPTEPGTYKIRCGMGMGVTYLNVI